MCSQFGTVYCANIVQRFEEEGIHEICIVLVGIKRLKLVSDILGTQQPKLDFSDNLNICHVQNISG